MASCTSEPYDPVSSQQPEADKVLEFSDNDAVQGKLFLKFTPDTAEAMAVTRSINDRSAITGFEEIDMVSAEIGAVEMMPLFEVGGRFEKRQREAGLHLWYVMTFDESIPATMAVPRFYGIEGIEIAEPMPIIRMPKPEFVAADLNNIATTSAAVVPPYPFNDTYLPLQWHYYNDGSMTGSLAGADINVFPAWELEAGDPNVIVAVIDGGVDGTHEDLEQNMWDDGYGHYGRNFDNNSYNIPRDDHGTHVAGTVAAVNNNYTGVSGVAGGNGSSSSGARIMSCHITHSIAANNAFVWAADSGAVIAQCSWELPNSTALEAAVNYFHTWAGTDLYGVQTGPMLGGLVVVAAGNSNLFSASYPAAYANVISVASFGPNGIRAPYSTWHSTVDISAPGGNMSSPFGSAGGVLSTLPYDNYAYYEGTSMAAPHVSGAAALVVSYCGGQGYTVAQLREALINSSNTVIYTYNGNRLYRNGLGRGRLDTYAALMY